MITAVDFWHNGGERMSRGRGRDGWMEGGSFSCERLRMGSGRDGWMGRWFVALWGFGQPSRPSQSNEWVTPSGGAYLFAPGIRGLRLLDQNPDGVVRWRMQAALGQARNLMTNLISNR